MVSSSLVQVGRVELSGPSCECRVTRLRCMYGTAYGTARRAAATAACDTGQGRGVVWTLGLRRLQALSQSSSHALVRCLWQRPSPVCGWIIPPQVSGDGPTRGSGQITLVCQPPPTSAQGGRVARDWKGMCLDAATRVLGLLRVLRGGVAAPGSSRGCSTSFPQAQARGPVPRARIGPAMDGHAGERGARRYHAHRALRRSLAGDDDGRSRPPGLQPHWGPAPAPAPRQAQEGSHRRLGGDRPSSCTGGGGGRGVHARRPQECTAATYGGRAQRTWGGDTPPAAPRPGGLVEVGLSKPGCALATEPPASEPAHV